MKQGLSLIEIHFLLSKSDQNLPNQSVIGTGDELNKCASYCKCDWLCVIISAVALRHVLPTFTFKGKQN